MFEWNAQAALLLLAALLWLAVASVGRWLMLRFADAQRPAELLRVSRWSMESLLLCWLGIKALSAAGVPSGTSVQVLGIRAANVIVRLGLGVSVWITSIRLLRVVSAEYIQRRFVGFGKHRARNASEVTFGLLYPFAAAFSLVIVLWLFNFNVAGWVVVGSALSVATAFAVQSILSSVVSGIFLAFVTTFSRINLFSFGSYDNIYLF